MTVEKQTVSRGSVTAAVNRASGAASLWAEVVRQQVAPRSADGWAKRQEQDASRQSDAEARRVSEERKAQNLARNSRRAREKQVAELESGIAALESRLQQLSHELEMAGVCSAVARVNELGREYAEVELQLHERLSEWSQVVEHQT